MTPSERRGMERFAADANDLLKALAWVASEEVVHYAKHHPRASRWTDIWAELRQSFGPDFDGGAKFQTSLFLLYRNRVTRSIRERCLFVGTGENPVETAVDLLTQLRSEIPEAFAPTIPKCSAIVVPGKQGSVYPVGILGEWKVGRA